MKHMQLEREPDLQDTDPLLQDESKDRLEQDDEDRNDVKQHKRYICGMAVKKNATAWNVFAEPLLCFLGISEVFYQLKIMPLLLKSEDHYAIPTSELDAASTTVIVCSCASSLIMAPIITYLYEIAGRRFTILYSLFSTVLLLILMPIVAPSFTMLCIVQALIGVSTTLLFSSPLVSDYVKRESRGQAVAHCLIACMLGFVVSSQILLPLTTIINTTKNFGLSFTLIAMFIFTFSMPLVFMIREPDIKRGRR